jgi:hypothetical protein
VFARMATFKVDDPRLIEGEIEATQRYTNDGLHSEGIPASGFLTETRTSSSRDGNVPSSFGKRNSKSGGRPHLWRGENTAVCSSSTSPPNDEAHTHFGRSMGGPMEAVGLSRPQLEHLDVLAIRLNAI